MKHQILSSLVLVVALAVSGCAAKGARNQARVGALGAIDAAVAVSQTETDLYAASLYPKPVHDQLVDAKLKVLYAARAFERAAALWPAGQAAPASVEAARQGALAAIADLEKVIPAIEKARVPLDLALQTLRSALAGRQSSRRSEPINQAALPGGGVVAIFAMAQLLAKLIATGRTTYERLHDLLKKEGATDDELAAADLKVSAEIARVEQEKQS